MYQYLAKAITYVNANTHTETIGLDCLQPACVNADVLGIVWLKLCVGGAVGNVIA